MDRAHGTEVIVTPNLVAEVGKIERSFVRQEARSGKQPVLSVKVSAETPANPIFQVGDGSTILARNTVTINTYESSESSSGSNSEESSSESASGCRDGSSGGGSDSGSGSGIGSGTPDGSSSGSENGGEVSGNDTIIIGVNGVESGSGSDASGGGDDADGSNGNASGIDGNAGSIGGEASGSSGDANSGNGIADADASVGCEASGSKSFNAANEILAGLNDAGGDRQLWLDGKPLMRGKGKGKGKGVNGGVEASGSGERGGSDGSGEPRASGSGLTSANRRVIDQGIFNRIKRERCSRSSSPSDSISSIGTPVPVAIIAGRRRARRRNGIFSRSTTSSSSTVDYSRRHYCRRYSRYHRCDIDLTVRRDCNFDLSDDDGSDVNGRRVRRKVSPSSGGGGGDDDNSVFVSDDDDYHPTPGECECE